MRVKSQICEKNGAANDLSIFEIAVSVIILAINVGVFTSVANAQSSTGYNFRGITATIEELDLAFDIKGKWTGQVDLQTVTQGAYLSVNGNPFAYWQRAHIRPWLQYHPSKTTMLAASVSYMKRYAIPPQENKRGDEVRLTLMANFNQPKSWGSFYQQARGEIKNNKSHGSTDWTHTPRARFRLGQNFRLKGEHQQQLVVYEEIMAKYKKHSKGFDILRFFGGYSYTKNQKWAVTAGFILQFQLNRNNTNVDVYFGPSIAVRYHFGRSKHPHPPPDPDID
jgi:hypothetical protein